MPTRTAYRFSDLTLDTGPRRLERGGDPIELGKLTYALLVALVEASPNVVSHDELVQRVWGGRMTSPETVTQRIKLLRDALGDDAEQPRYIGLVRGQGYRLIPALARVKPQGWPAHVDPAPAHARRRGAVPVAVAVTLVLGAAGVLYIATRPTTPDPYVAARPAGDLEFSQLTATGNAVHPAISPDGRYVVYVRTAPNDRLNFESLWVRQIAASTHIEIVPAQPNLGVAMPTVSPDGNFVDFLRLKPEGGPALWRVPILGGAPRLIAERVFSAVGWSPDGRQMAFIREETSGNALVIADAEGRGERVLATRHVPAYFLSLATVLVPDVRPAWSPDGRVIALFEYRDLETLLVLVDTATGAETVRDPGGSYFPQGVAWLGPQALVLSQPEAVGKNQQLWRLSYPEAVVSRLTNDMATYVGLGVDRTGASVVTSRSETRVTVWAGDAAWVESAKISRPLLFGGSIAWVSWAGERVLFDTTINDRSGVAAVTPGEDAEPTEILGDAVQGVATSDGSTFIFIRGTEGLWQADAEGRPPRQLVTGDGLAVEPRITPDDRSVIFLSSRSGVMSPWIVPVGGGEPNEIVRTNTAILDVSHDGRRLLFASGDERNAPIVVTCDLPACTNRREHAFPANYTGGRGRIRFMPDGQGIAYVGGRGATNLWTMSLEGGAPTQLTHFADQAVETDGPIARFAFSHDGERLALTRIKTTSDIVLVRGLQN